MRNRAGLLIVIGIALLAGSAWADGNILAASAKTQTLSFEGTRTLLSGLGGTDVCTTIINRSDKTGLIRLTLTDVGAAAATSEIAKAKSSGLCGEDMESVAVTCLGPPKCAFT